MKEAPVTHYGFLFPSGLLTVEEMATEMEIPRDRLAGFAASCYCPHYRVDGGPPLFSRAEMKQWAKKSLVEHCEGSPFPSELTVIQFDRADFCTDPIPSAIASMPNLCRLPMIPRTSGVYFLCKAKEVIYVGQSVDVPSRVRQHPYDYDAVFFLPVPTEHLNEVEGAFIRTLRPKENSLTHGTPTVNGDPFQVVAAFMENRDESGPVSAGPGGDQ